MASFPLLEILTRTARMCDEFSVAASVLYKFALRLPVSVKHLQEYFHVYYKASEKIFKWNKSYRSCEDFVSILHAHQWQPVPQWKVAFLHLYHPFRVQRKACFANT